MFYFAFRNLPGCMPAINMQPLVKISSRNVKEGVGSLFWHIDRSLLSIRVRYIRKSAFKI